MCAQRRMAESSREELEAQRRKAEVEQAVMKEKWDGMPSLSSVPIAAVLITVVVVFVAVAVAAACPLRMSISLCLTYAHVGADGGTALLKENQKLSQDLAQAQLQANDTKWRTVEAMREEADAVRQRFTMESAVWKEKIDGTPLRTVCCC